MAELRFTYRAPSGQTIRLFKGDLTEEDTDAIVNAANEHLAHGGGVAGAIVRKGGHVIQEESNRIGHVPTGQAAITGGGRLKARHVIHAVGPVYREGDPRMDELLTSAVWTSLLLADEHRLTSIAFPAISSGIFGFPKDKCAHDLIAAAIKFTREFGDSSLRDIRFTLIDETTVGYFLKEFQKQFGEARSR